MGLLHLLRQLSIFTTLGYIVYFQSQMSHFPGPSPGWICGLLFNLAIQIPRTSSMINTKINATNYSFMTKTEFTLYRKRSFSFTIENVPYHSQPVLRKYALRKLET